MVSCHRGCVPVVRGKVGSRQLLASNGLRGGIGLVALTFGRHNLLMNVSHLVLGRLNVGNTHDGVWYVPSGYGYFPSFT